MPAISMLLIPLGWPDGWSQRIGFESPALEVRGTADGRLEVIAGDRSFLSQPLEVPRRGTVVFVVQIGETGEPEVWINGVRLGASHEPLLLDPTPQPDWPASVVHPRARAACRPFMEARIRSHAVPLIRPGRRRRTLAEELDKLDDAAEVLEGAIAALRAQEPAFFQPLLSVLRALVVTGDSPNSTPALQRVAALLDEPLPVYAIRSDALPPVGDLLARGAPQIEAWFSTEELMDLDDALALVARTADDRVLTNLDYLRELASTEASHIDGAVPIWADAPKKVENNGLTVDIAHLLTLGATVLTLCRHIVAVGRASSKAVDEALRRTYRTWTRLGASSSTPGWFDARRAIDLAQRNRDFAAAAKSARCAREKSDNWTDLLEQLESLHDLAEQG